MRSQHPPRKLVFDGRIVARDGAVLPTPAPISAPRETSGTLRGGPSSSRRYSTGSLPAAAESSSTNEQTGEGMRDAVDRRNRQEGETGSRQLMFTDSLSVATCPPA